MPKNTKNTSAQSKPEIAIPQTKKHTVTKWVAGCCAVLILFFSVMMNFVLGVYVVHTVTDGIFGKGSQYDESVVASHGRRDDKIALLHLSGVIASPSDPGSLLSQQGNTQDVLNQLDVAMHDSAVQAVIIEVDSPGGSVTASEDLFQKISDVQEAGIPVVTYVHTESASGAYYATCGTDYIYANPTSLNGSIGVILQAYNYGDLLNKYGVHIETYKSGPYKDMLSGTRATTAQEKEIVQGIIDSSYNIFVDHVVKGRKLEKAAVLKVADGRVLTAQQAKDAKLIDEVGFQEDAITKAAALGNTANYDVVEYHRSGGLLSRLGGSSLGASISFVAGLLQGNTQKTGVYFL